MSIKDRFGFNLPMREIPGYTGYRITRGGRVFSCWLLGQGNTGVVQQELAYRKHDQPPYYQRVSLRNARLKRTEGVHVHQLLALAYVPNPDDLPCVRHIEEYKGPAQNHADNLMWGTHADNSRDYHSVPRVRIYKRFPLAKVIEAYTCDDYTRVVAERLGMSFTTVAKIRTGDVHFRVTRDLIPGAWIQRRNGPL